jgi:DNA-binding CsgD family transcriptional regulator
MILRVAHFRLSPESAGPAVARAQSLLARLRHAEGLTWSAVGRQPDGDSVTIISVSLWRDRAAIERSMGPVVDGRSQAEALEGLPATSMLELADVVDDVEAGASGRDGASGDVPGRRRRRGLLPQDRELLRLLCGGSTLAEAAGRLGVSVGTAKNRRHELYEKLGVHDLESACALTAGELAAGTGAIAG